MAPNPNDRTHDAVYSVISANNKAYMDIIGSLPYFPSQGNEYVLTACYYYSNAIVGVPIKNWQAVTITKPWQYLHKTLCSTGINPKAWILDNEASNFLQSSMTKYKTKYYLVPPHIYITNSAERAIQTIKNSFKI